VHLLGDVGQSLHYIFPGIVARVANKSSGYELVNDLAGGHSVPEVSYDCFADRRFEGFDVIVNVNHHAATKVAKLCHFMARVQCPGCTACGYRKTVVQDAALAG
jgi:hypothetical protein